MALSVQKTGYNHDFVGYCCHSVASSLYLGLSDTTHQFDGQVVGHVSCSTEAKINPSAFFLGPDQESQELLCPRQNMWVQPGRTDSWWDNFMQDVVMWQEWKENFCMQRDAFFKLCSELRPYIERKITNMRQPIDVEKQVAVTLYFLSDEGRLRKTANAFGASRASTSICIRRGGHRQYPCTWDQNISPCQRQKRM